MKIIKDIIEIMYMCIHEFITIENIPFFRIVVLKTEAGFEIKVL